MAAAGRRDAGRRLFPPALADGQRERTPTGRDHVYAVSVNVPLVSALVAAHIAASAIAPPALLPHAQPWHVGTRRVASAGCPRCIQVDSWGATVPYRDAPNDFPQRTMAVLGKNDVIIQVIRSWEPSPPRWVYTRRALRIRRSQIHANFEGNTTHGRVSLWSASTWRNGSLVQVYVFFGSSTPRPETVARAQRELDRTAFPRWVVRR